MLCITTFAKFVVWQRTPVEPHSHLATVSGYSGEVRGILNAFKFAWLKSQRPSTNVVKPLRLCCQQRRRLVLPTTRMSGSRETNASQRNVTYEPERARSLRHRSFHLLLDLLRCIIRADRQHRYRRPAVVRIHPRRLAPRRLHL